MKYSYEINLNLTCFVKQKLFASQIVISRLNLILMEVTQVEEKRPSRALCAKNKPTIDYESLFPQFLGGYSYQVLADKHNISFDAIRKYGLRHDWEIRRQELNLSLKVSRPQLDPIKNAQMIVEARQKYIQNVSKASANVSESLIEKVESVKTFEDKALAMSQFKPAADIGKSIFGIGSESPSSLQVNFLSNLDLKDVQPIDVTDKVTKKELGE